MKFTSLHIFDIFNEAGRAGKPENDNSRPQEDDSGQKTTSHVEGSGFRRQVEEI
jgi:hypothetical protein